MLDSSPIPLSPPKRLKRTASVASLPSPPPSVEQPKKRTTSQRFGTEGGSGDEDGAGEIAEDRAVGRKLLFPAGPSTCFRAEVGDNNPFMDKTKPTNVNGQLALDSGAYSSVQCVSAPASPPPSKRKAPKGPIPSSCTPSPVEQRGRCTALELPVLDEKNNPFLVDSPPKSRHPHTPRELTEQPTMTYVFKGIKTSVPNPNYNLPESVYGRARLPLSHPDYSPLPTRAPRRLFPEAYDSADQSGEEEVADTNDRIGGVETDMRTPDTKPRMSKLFVDAAGNPLPDSGPQGVRGETMDARDIGRMAVGPIRGRG